MCWIDFPESIIAAIDGEEYFIQKKYKSPQPHKNTEDKSVGRIIFLSLYWTYSFFHRKTTKKSIVTKKTEKLANHKVDIVFKGKYENIGKRASKIKNKIKYIYPLLNLFIKLK